MGTVNSGVMGANVIYHLPRKHKLKSLERVKTFSPFQKLHLSTNCLADCKIGYFKVSGVPRLTDSSIRKS